MARSGTQDALATLAHAIAVGFPGPDGGAKAALDALFGGRYAKRHAEPAMFRDAYALANDDAEGGVPYAGLINPANSQSGPYGGTSVVWFPTKEHGSLIGFGVGTGGVSPDEGILLRPGHRRRIRALRRYLARLGVDTWTKSDPAAIDVPVPKAARDRFPGFERVFTRYGREMYCNAIVPTDPDLGRRVVQAFFDLYAYERRWQILQACQSEMDSLLSELHGDLFPAVEIDAVAALIRARRFVVLQGPPGTGKTRIAGLLLRDHFGGHGMTVQFHPAVTYEDFVVGLAPEPAAGGLHFVVRRGWLLEAIRRAGDRPFLLVIDEINRADLGKVLGEAIHLFEAGEVGVEGRSISLPHPVGDDAVLRLPENLFVVATMNTADRSIASLDLAVRRRFAFVPVPPERNAVARSSTPLAVKFFERILDVFTEHAPDEALELMPGHSYFLARDNAELVERFRYELLPLLDEYLRQGLLGQASHELATVRDAIEDVVSGGHAE